MTNRTAATRYARALLDVAQREHADPTVIEGQLASLATLFNEHEGLRKSLLNPAVPKPRKRAVVAEIIGKVGVLPIVSKTLLLMADNDRLALIPDVAEAVSQRLLEVKNIVRAEVTTASALPAERLADIQRSLATATGCTVDVTAKVDPSIVGGMIARVGSTVFDGSVVNHLQRLRQRLDATL